MEKIDTDEFLKETYGVSKEKVDASNVGSWFAKHGNNMSKVNAALSDFPFLMKDVYTKDYYSDVYRVIYDKGIGELQRSAKHPELFRANVVQYGTNNHVTGQAELELLQPDKLMELSDIALSAFKVASIATNQYFLSRIDNKLSSIEENVNEIKRFLSLDKESEIAAENEYIANALKNIEYVEQNDIYRQSILNEVQFIKLKALQNIIFYQAKLDDVKSSLNIKDKQNETNTKLINLKNYFSELWLSISHYGLCAYLETRLSGVTDKDYLEKMIDDVLERILAYKDCYEEHNKNLHEYVERLNRLKPNEILPFISKMSWLLDIGGLYGYIADGAVKFVANAAHKADSEKKESEKSKLINTLENYLKPYSDIDELETSVKGIMMIEAVYTERVEVLMNKDAAYMSFDTPDTATAIKRKYETLSKTAAND